jgi:hypothetical protein
MFCTLGGQTSPSFLTEFSLNAGGPACWVVLQIHWNVSCSLLNTRVEMLWSDSEICWYISWSNLQIWWYELSNSLMELNAHGLIMIHHQMGGRRIDSNKPQAMIPEIWQTSLVIWKYLVFGIGWILSSKYLA